MSAPVAPRRAEWRQTRELLRNLVGKELKVRYKRSVLGVLWSLLTPLLITAIFTVVFATFLRIGVDDFASLFLSGYLVWQFFSNSINACVGTIASNASLVRKVRFRREVLPLSIVLSQAVHLGLAFVATSWLFVLQRGNVLPFLPAAAVGFVLLVAFTSGVGMVFAGANVRYRDLQELTPVLFQAWFYGTPIIYPLFFVAGRADWALPLIQANPMTWFVQLFQNVFYGTALRDAVPDDPSVVTSLGPHWPSWQTLGICTAWALGALAIGWWYFQRQAVTFAKEV